MPIRDFQDTGFMEKLNFLCPFCTDFLVPAKGTGNSLVSPDPWIICSESRAGEEGKEEEEDKKLHPRFYHREKVEEVTGVAKPPGITLLGKQQPRSCSWPGMVPPTTIHINIFLRWNWDYGAEK